jgi:competence protein ComEA
VRAGAGAALVLVLLGLAAAVLVTALTPHGGTTVVAPSASRGASGTDSGSGAAPDASPSSALVYVQVVGHVARPGLYQVREGDRVMDAVAAAGGFAPDADQAAINLARVVSDGEQIQVPAVGEAPVAGSGATGGAGGGSGAVPGAKVNLNTADATALETLPRVGPATAQKIIDWRTKNGRFRSVQDLRSVSGIGDATFDQLKDLVTV